MFSNVEQRNSETQQPVGMIKLYRRTHFNSKGWTSHAAEENYDRMQQLKDELEAEGAMPKTEDKILNMVLGVRSGYSKGLGHGVLPQSSKRVSSIQLEEEVQRRRDEEEFQRRRAEEAKKRNEELKAEIVSQRKKIEEMDARQQRFEAWMLQSMPNLHGMYELCLLKLISCMHA
ncbi:hypothetical protein GIB67_042490 [Kingdonia uniflora]|uniref:Uncharacterized protein n=1 Tax=Kingdonia uniflora TaxID=39325 RepID=A0A7J7M0X5_9MAGN|nr:hypothetical protein GIB67_042490 [Kingdonia uniflora]